LAKIVKLGGSMDDRAGQACADEDPNDQENQGDNNQRGKFDLDHRRSPI
jgi:hypothetical protein